MPRAWIPVGLCLLLTACGMGPALKTVSAVRAPSRPGLIVRVPIAALPAELQSAPDVQVCRGKTVIPSAVRSDPDGAARDLVFEVTGENRHSPFGVYTILDGHSAPLPGGDSRTECYRAEPFLQPAPAALGAQQAAPAWLRALKVDPATDYLAVAPRAYLDGLLPLLEHRASQGFVPTALAVEDLFALYSGGDPTPESLADAIHAVSASGRARLRFVLLVGDCESRYEPAGGAQTPVPTFYRPKMHYQGMFGSGGGEYPTDAPYADACRDSEDDAWLGPAVGRVPARDEAEVRAFVRKAVDYETVEVAGEWQRRLSMFAGPAEYSPRVDALIEGLALNILNHWVPYDYDVRVLFAKQGSPFAYRFDKLGERIVADLNVGALLAAYVGHGNPGSFDSVTFRGHGYRIGAADDIAQVHIPTGKPFFLCLTCHNGAYDRRGGRRSIAEELVLNPAGPIAALASSRVSHPYGNALLAQSFVATFVQGRPRTVGEGMLALKQDMLGRTIPMASLMLKDDPVALKLEHKQLYNLLGDPATRLRYPLPLSVKAPATARVGEHIRVGAQTSAVSSGRGVVTLEVARNVLLRPLEPVTDSMGRDEAFAAMARNHESALNKIVGKWQPPVRNGGIVCDVAVPATPGEYIVKVIAVGEKACAAGHTRLRVVVEEP